jgi:glycosyltransferase involved in cell wall biosynthesis
MKNAVVISTTPGEPSFAGGSLGVYGNLVCISACGYEVISIVISKVLESSNPAFRQIIIDQSREKEHIEAELSKHLEALNPEVVWLHHCWTWPYFEALAGNYPFVLLAGDPEWEILKLRYQNSKKPNNLIKRVYYKLLNTTALWNARELEKGIFRATIKNNGVIGCWCTAIINELARENKVEMFPCPLGFVDFGLREVRKKKSILMLGNLDSANTRSGVIYFLTKFWPAWRREPLSSKYQIRMVGSGKLSAHLKLPDNNPQFEWVGYVEDLSTEWENALALFVPVPERMGFRTRVIESWIRGVPVVAHPKNEESVPEMKDGINYIAVDDAASMKRAIQKLEDIDYYSRLIDSGRQTYLKCYSINAVYGTYSTLSQQAINLKRVS